MTIFPKKSFKVRTRLGFIAMASILAILLIGVIAWYGFKEARTQISTFQIENIPQLKNSLKLSELGTALEAFSLTIPSATNQQQLNFYQGSLKIRVSEIDELFDQLLLIHEQILARDPDNVNVQMCKQHIISLEENKKNLQANLTQLLAITETMIALENQRQALFDDVSQHTTRIRTNFRKKIDDSNTELQIYLQHLDVVNEGEIGQKTKLLTERLEKLRNIMEGLADSEKMYGSLSIAASSQNKADIENIGDIFNANLPIFMTRIKRIGDSDLDEKIKEDMKVIAKSGIGKESIFDIRQRQFEARGQSATLTAETKQNIFVMRDKIDTIVGLINQENQRGNQATLQKTDEAIKYILILIPLVAAIIAGIAYLLGRSIVRPLTEAVNVANAIAGGNLNNQIEINLDNKDEVNQLLQAFASMQTQLRERIEQDKQVANEALRINSALDSVTTSVFIADNHHQIIYFNKAAESLLTKEENHFRQRFNNFEISKMLGETMDIYHSDPLRQRQLVENLTGSYNSKFKMGDLTIDAMVTPVVNADGERLGTVAEFRDITAQVAVEQEINIVIAAASKGDFQQRIDLSNKTGFFRIFSEGLNQIIDYNQLAVKDTMRMFAALAKGNLTQTITNDYVGAFEQMKQDANETVKKLTDIMTVIKQTADSVGKVVGEISHSNIVLNQRAEEQTKFLEQTGTSTEEITATVRQNADNAKYAAELATIARERAQQGGEVVGHAIVAISEINDSSKRVADIIGVIDEIAFQTNLLALNAAVEAARAGEQGRGFAVVATEVRNLAQRSAAAAKEIKALIQDSVAKVAEGTKLADRSGRVLEEIVVAFKKVSDLIAEIAAASQEQAIGIQQINQTIVQMDKMTQQNATIIEENAVATRILAEQAQNLRQQVAFFDVGV